MQRSRAELKSREAVSQEVSTLAARLQLELNADVFLAKGMVAHLHASPNAGREETMRALSALYDFGRNLKNIGLAPGNRIQYVYPEEGNQGVVGLFYPDLPKQWPAVKQAIDKKETMLAGPLVLKQGGLGLISRTPIFLEGEHYWGILSLVLDAEKLMKTVTAAEKNGQVRLALQGTDGLGERGDIFWGDPALFTETSVIQVTPVPGGFWRIAAAPVEGWGHGDSYLAETFGVLLGAFASVITLALRRNRQKMLASQSRLAAFAEATHDGILIVDVEDRIREANPAAAKLIGLPLDGIVDRTLSNFITPEASGEGLLYINRPEPGETVFVEATVGKVDVNGESLRLFSLRDVGDRLAAETALRESETKFRTLASQIPGVIFQWAEYPGGDRGFTYVGPHADSILGQSSEDLMEDWTCFQIHPDDAPRWDTTIREAVQTLQDWEFEGRRMVDTDIRWWQAYSRPTRLADGTVLFTGVTFDITDQKRAERALADKQKELSSVLATIVDGIITIDEKGLMRSANPAAERLFGYSVTEMVGKNVKMLMPEDITGNHGHYLEAYRETGRDSIIGVGRTVTGRRRDGSLFPLDLSMSETMTSEARVYTGIVRDATERVAHERELEKNKTALERRATELTTLAVELEAARDEAERANEAKSRFLAMMSHELRTPVTGVLGMAELLLASPLEPKQQNWTRILKRSGDILLTLLNDILDVSKIEADCLVLERIDFDPRTVLAEVVELLENTAHEKNVTLTWTLSEDVPPILLGDPTRLGQILFNLIGNGIKFTPYGSVQIDVTYLTTDEQNTDRLHVRVSDTGIGMTAEEIERLFRPFSQAETSTVRRFGGTGLGLAISKSLIEKMEGTIGCESTKGEGSTFWFTIATTPGSVDSLPQTALHHHPISFREARSLHVLVAEDNEVNRALLKDVLEMKGHSAIVVENGELAVEAAARESFDLILMDLQMPVMDGLEAARLIRAGDGPNAEGVPIVVLTADVLAEAQLFEQPCLISKVLTKPLDWDRLNHLLHDLSTEEAGQSRINRPREKHQPESGQGMQKIRPNTRPDESMEDESLQTLDVTGSESPPLDHAGDGVGDTDQKRLAVFSTDWMTSLASTLPPEKLTVILQSLVTRLEGFARDLPALSQSEAPDQLRRFAHGVYGMASQFGLEQLAVLSQRILENQGDPQDGAPLDGFDREITAAKAAVADHIAKGGRA
ncbi:PAS domain S-box protein [Rhodospirillum sp. A1_3_36]|uniref:PAS domain S-box protein n=1 Tax=Rhodospirillum sp. A1_3_36 TaxID=3391666 RepID=UPI0039A4728E